MSRIDRTKEIEIGGAILTVQITADIEHSPDEPSVGYRGHTLIDQIVDIQIYSPSRKDFVPVQGKLFELIEDAVNEKGALWLIKE